MPAVRAGVAPGPDARCRKRKPPFFAVRDDGSGRESSDISLPVPGIVEIVRPRDIGREQCLDLMKQVSDPRVSEIARALEIDVEHLGDGGTRSGQHHADAIGKQYSLRDIMGDEHDRLARAPPYFE